MEQFLAFMMILTIIWAMINPEKSKQLAAMYLYDAELEAVENSHSHDSFGGDTSYHDRSMKEKLKIIEKHRQANNPEPIPADERANLLRRFLFQNFTSYVNEPICIGFTHDFPEDPSKTEDTMTIEEPYRNTIIKFNVRLTKVTFGKKNEYSVTGIVTDRAEIVHPGPLGGWGSHSYISEAAMMERAVVKMATKHGMMVCQKVCSWPFAKAIVQPAEDVHLRSFKKQFGDGQ